MPQPSQLVCILIILLAKLSAADAKLPVTFAWPRQTETGTGHAASKAQEAVHYGYVQDTEEIRTRIVHKTDCKSALLLGANNEDFIFQTFRTDQVFWDREEGDKVQHLHPGKTRHTGGSWSTVTAASCDVSSTSALSIEELNALVTMLVPVVNIGTASITCNFDYLPGRYGRQRQRSERSELLVTIQATIYAALAISDESNVAPVLDGNCGTTPMSESAQMLLKNVTALSKTKASPVQASKADQENSVAKAKFFGLVIAATGPITGTHGSLARPFKGGWFETVEPIVDLGVDSIEQLLQVNPGVILPKAKLWSPTFYLDEAE